MTRGTYVAFSISLTLYSNHRKQIRSISIVFGMNAAKYQKKKILKFEEVPI